MKFRYKKYRLKEHKFAIIVTLITLVTLVFVLLLQNHSIQVFSPKGVIAEKERNLIVLVVAIMLAVVIPLLTMAFTFAWKYRASNDKLPKKYSPDFEQSKIWRAIWLLPASVVLVLSIITWKNTRVLDPFKPILADTKPLTIQVVALRWKWLFIYPEQNIATVNFVEFPKDTPINFELTADAPMSSFWIPQLSGQMYAMSGMATQLHVMASQEGEFPGSAAEINGPGFADMKFVAKSTSSDDFENWANSVRQGSKTLNWDEYTNLANPSEKNPQELFSSVDNDLFNKVITKFMPYHTH